MQRDYHLVPSGIRPAAFEFTIRLQPDRKKLGHNAVYLLKRAEQK
jgi:hypothetical protein